MCGGPSSSFVLSLSHATTEDSKQIDRYTMVLFGRCVQCDSRNDEEKEEEKKLVVINK